MSKIIILTGSSRPNSAGTGVVKLAEQHLASTGSEAQVVDVRTLNLPFFDSPLPPSAEGYEISHDEVRQWSEIVKSADGVVFMLAEYNHAMTAIQKNAIDWLYSEWNDKPSAVIGYGFYAGQNSIDNFKIVNSVVKTDLVEPIIGLQFNQDIGMDGSIDNPEAVSAKIAPALDALIQRVTG